MNTEPSLLRRAAITHRLRWLVLIWAVGIAFGFGCLFNYQTVAGQLGSTPWVFPEVSKVQRDQDRPTLIMFAHPRCPCTRASLGELAKVMTRLHDKVRAYVVFYVPRSTGADWTASELVLEAEAIPNVRVIRDLDGHEIRRFGVETSGHVLLFDRAGQLSFTGGITMSRGHSGDNTGAEKLMRRATQAGSGVPCEHVVFGCPLIDEAKIKLEKHNE